MARPSIDSSPRLSNRYYERWMNVDKQIMQMTRVELAKLLQRACDRLCGVLECGVDTHAAAVQEAVAFLEEVGRR